MYPDYLAAIESLDDNLGRLINVLKEKGIYDNTTIIYTSDHGCHFKTRNMEYKRSCHDASIHIPLVIKSKEFSKGIKDDRIISLVDLPPTLLSLAGINIPNNYQGASILNNEKGECAFVQISETQCGRAIRTKDFTYSVYSPLPLSSYSHIYFEDYLYDNRIDISQKNNLIKSKEYSEIKKNLKKLLLEEIKKVEGKSPVILPAWRVKSK